MRVRRLAVLWVLGALLALAPAAHAERWEFGTNLPAARTGAAARLKDLNGLAEKAKTGAGGAAVAEIAYGNDLVTTRAQAKLIEDVWQRNHCDSAPTPPQKPDPAAAAKDLNATGQRNRSGVR